MLKDFGEYSKESRRLTLETASKEVTADPQIIMYSRY